jgi:hypothetical protein
MSGNQDVGQVDPNLRLAGDPRGKIRYPSPFFDLSQQYIPPTVKELFKWVYFYCTNNSFLGPALNKIAKYPVTDLIFEDADKNLVKHWTSLMNNTLQVKTFNMEVNLDLTSYGNAFVTIHFPFSRLLECTKCKTRSPWKSVMKKIDNLVIKGKCPKCRHDGAMAIRDVPYKSTEHLRLLRINPEYIDIKYNETTGRHTYLYSIPDRLKRQIMAGDPDILEDTPQIYIEAIKQKRKIKLANENLFHLKNPTLAGKDMGWGMPRIAVALKDLYHYYILRRAQEAVMNEHIVPFDILFPQANGKMDPYVNTDLSSWKKQMEKELANRRRDPNYKAIMPFPVGVERIGGDGKALMLTPEMDFLAKTIVGACGIPQEFIYGGTMNWSGSSISLRTLENDFLHQRTQLLQMNIWVVERTRLYLGSAAPKSARFSDFKMADDMQKMQIMVGMASNNKLPWEDIQREFGRDPEVVKKKIEEEAAFDAKLKRSMIVQDAEAQAQAQGVQLRFQQKQQSNVGGTENQEAVDKITAESVSAIATRIAQSKPEEQEQYLERIKALDVKFAKLVEKALENIANGHSPVPTPEEQQVIAGKQQQAQDDLGLDQQKAQHEQQMQQQQQKHEMQLSMKDQSHKQKVEHKKDLTKGPVNMKKLPEQKPPRRQGGI